VNFIGVPIAAWQSYEAWVASGVAADEFSMQVSGNKSCNTQLFTCNSWGSNGSNPYGSQKKLKEL
jgi:hypothetical protein